MLRFKVHNPHDYPRSHRLYLGRSNEYLSWTPLAPGLLT